MTSNTAHIQPSQLASAVGGGPARRLLALPGVVVIVGALLTAAASFVILVGATPITPDQTTIITIGAINAFFIVLMVALIWRELRRIYMARQQARAASRLHVRIVTMFALVAAIPAVIVALIAALTLNIGLDRWFEMRTKNIIGYSMQIADAYVRENARNLQGTTLSMAYDLDSNRQLYGLDRNGFIDYLTAQAAGRALAHAALVSADGKFQMTAQTKADFPMPPVPEGVLTTAADGLPVLIAPGSRSIVGAVIKLKQIEGMYLYTIRLVDPEVIRAREIVRANTNEYSDLEDNRSRFQAAFALPYLALTLIVVLSAIWTGIAVADRLVRPIRQLIGAASEVSAGNLEASVPVRVSDGDVGQLANTFNKMIGDLKSQRNELVSAKDTIDERRRFTEAVLGGVTAGVIGVDDAGIVTIINSSAEAMLEITSDEAVGKSLNEISPQLAQVFEIGKSSEREVYRDQATFFKNGSERAFNVRITTEDAGPNEIDQSYIVTFDDITDLVAAQRSSAWADVARRIAHEIKNPLTPIQLSAERIRRRYGKVITEDREVFDQCTDTIIRQVGDIGRMVDEFSAFARMPKPEMKTLDLREPLREAYFLVEVSRPDITFERDFSDTPLKGTFDSRLMAQAFGNIIKNASEAIDGREGEAALEQGAIKVRAETTDNELRVDVIDNGKGLPREHRQKLLEPYMTTREKGTGLGLAIVKKIVEDHGGRLELHDAPADFHGGKGAMVSIILPAAVNETDEKFVPDLGSDTLKNGQVANGI